MTAPICIIFNPTARGDKAKHFRQQLGALGDKCVLKPSTHPGAARSLAAEAVREGFQTIVAAGGDGTVNEVLNGMVEAQGLNNVRLAVIPLGTINVFAKELGLPTSLSASWDVVLHGSELVIDLPAAEFTSAGKLEKRYFAQLAGAGLDSRAIAGVDWDLKKKVGPLAYISAGIQALRGKQCSIVVTAGERVEQGELVLIGNGRFYGGRIGFFPQADLQDGVLEICIFPKVDLAALARCGWGLLTDQMLKGSGAIHLKDDDFVLSCETEVPFELDGDNAGSLPARFTVEKQKLKVLVPRPGV